jgi:hypothetical protein
MEPMTVLAALQGVVTKADATFSQQIFNIAEAQTESET